MLINAVCKECSVTKKAVEYYIEQGLVSPTVQENGYRDFSEEDIRRLKKISILRNLGLSVTDIQDVLFGETAVSVLNEIYHRRNLQMTVLQEKQKLIQKLASTHDWEQVQNRLCQLQKEQTILERLMNAFPGYYGKFLCLHFAPYLNEPVSTDRQQEAYDTIVSFLDKVDFDIPADLREYLDEITITLDESFMERLTRSVSAVIHETEKYIADNKEIIESRIAYKQSEEYKASTAYSLEKALRQFNSASGYDDIFIPAMCQLSESYQKYHEELSAADKVFLQKYPGLT